MLLRHRLIVFLPLCAMLCMIVPTPAAPVTKPADASSPTVAVRLVGSDGKAGPVTEVSRVVKTDSEWEKQLGPTAYRVLRAKGTEAPFC